MQEIRVETQLLETEEQLWTANRSRLYSLFSDAFRYPGAGFSKQVREGVLARSARDLLAGLPYAIPSADEVAGRLAVPVHVQGEEMEVEFIRLFEAGIGGPPCPLVEGGFDKDRRTLLKELVVFYNHFGLSYAEGSQEERPDHICLQMEFLHYLTFKEVHAIQTGSDASGYRRAQRDFLERHPLGWIGKLEEKVLRICEKQLPDDVSREAVLFYGNLITLIHRYLQADHRYLQDRLQG